MNPTGLAVVILGAWVITQVLAGDAIGRLNLL
jgi:hypothetical protein